MSRKVREWLRELELYERTTHQDRVDIDMEIERRTGKYCDHAIEEKRITEKEFREIVELILKRKKKKKQEAVMVV